METTLIKLVDYCRSRNIESNFIEILSEYDLLQITVQQEEEYIHEDQLRDLERFTNWHYELDINPAGIQVANHLIQKLEQLQLEIQQLKNHIRAIEV